MMSEMIVMLQLMIWVIVAVMMGMVALYFYFMKPSHTKDTYNSNNEKNNEENVEYIKKQYIDDGLNNKEDDDGPIQHL